MKRLLALAFAASLLGCAEPPSPTAATRETQSATRGEAASMATSSISEWTTARLQQRRADLYAAETQWTTKRGVSVNAVHGTRIPTSRQREIKAIEAELNRRYQAGDKAAKLKSI
jgi:Tfp pilus assembly protein PilV